MMSPGIRLNGQSANEICHILACTLICKFLSIPDGLKLRKGECYDMVASSQQIEITKCPFFEAITEFLIMFHQLSYYLIIT